MNALQVISKLLSGLLALWAICRRCWRFRHFHLFSLRLADASPSPITAGSLPDFGVPDLYLFCDHPSAEWQPGNVSSQILKFIWQSFMCRHRDLRTAGCRTKRISGGAVLRGLRLHSSHGVLTFRRYFSRK